MERVRRLHELLDELTAVDDMGVSSLAEASVLAGALERASRKLDSLAIRVVDQVDRGGLQSADGHGSVVAWSAFACRTSRREAARRVRAARMFRSLGATGVAYAAGEVGRDQVDQLSLAFRNPRCGGRLVGSQDLLLEDARSLPFRDFEKCVARWVELADADGAEARHDTKHENRDARFIPQFDAGYRLDGCFGAAQGAVLKNLFEGFVNALRLADWEAAKAEHGEGATVAQLCRTEAQRRADAMVEAFTQAAAMLPGAVRPEPSVFVVFSAEAFDAAVARFAGVPVSPLDPRNYRSWRCETTDGVQLSLSDALGAALAGELRRVVLTVPEASVSRKARLFTGAVRDLVNVRETFCTWPGCDIPSRFCQADHNIPFRAGGLTTASNGTPKCGRHNRFKEHGYRTWKDADGRWHVQRPDGTLIEPAA